MRHLEGALEAEGERGIGRTRRGGKKRENEQCGEPWACPAPKIGPAAHVASPETADTGNVVDERLPGVVTEIRSLLDVPEGAAAPSREEVERTLTNGYAYALALEGECLRIERRLRTLFRSEGARTGAADEVADLTGRLAHTDQELAGVRALLSSLRAQAL
jgi:hypothetical protein